MKSRLHRVIVCGFAVAAFVALTPAFAQQKPLDQQVALSLQRILNQADENPDGAIEELGRLMRNYRRRPDQQVYIMQQRAGLLMQAEQYDTVATEMAALLADKEPDFALDLRLTYAKVLLMLDRIDDARAALEHWREHQEIPNGVGFFLLGYAYVRLEQFEAAAIELEKAVGMSDKPLVTWIELLSFAYARSGRPDEAVALLEGLIELIPDKARWWRHLGVLYQTLDEVGKSTAVYSVVDVLDDLTVLEAKNLASMMGYMGMPYDGALLFESRLRADEQRTDLLSADESADEPVAGDSGLDGQTVDARFSYLMLLAKLWMSAREFDRAVATLEQAAELGEDGEAQLLMGQLHLHWERYGQALEAFNEATRAYAEEVPPRLHYLAAVAAMNLGEDEEARLALMQIEDDPSYGERAARLVRQLDANRVVAGN
jgi:tetratricopeptide (TPR) repeat protein